MFSFGNQETNRHKQGQELCQHDGQPYTGNADQFRQDQHDDDLEHESTQKGDCCGYSSVVQGCEKDFPLFSSIEAFLLFIRFRTKWHIIRNRITVNNFLIVSLSVSLYNNFGISSGRSAVRPYRQCLGSPY